MFTSYIDNRQTDEFEFEMWIFIWYLILVWLSTAIFYANYLLHTTETYTVDLDQKSIYDYKE